MKIRELAVTILIAISCTSSVLAAETNEQQASDRPEAATVETQTPAAVILEKRFTFDPVVDGSAVAHDFLVTNEGEGALEISKVKTG